MEMAGREVSLPAVDLSQAEFQAMKLSENMTTSKQRKAAYINGRDNNWVCGYCEREKARKERDGSLQTLQKTMGSMTAVSEFPTKSKKMDSKDGTFFDLKKNQ